LSADDWKAAQKGEVSVRIRARNVLAIGKAEASLLEAILQVCERRFLSHFAHAQDVGGDPGDHLGYGVASWLGLWACMFGPCKGVVLEIISPNNDVRLSLPCTSGKGVERKIEEDSRAPIGEVHLHSGSVTE
jgi:hypothetical protein